MGTLTEWMRVLSPNQQCQSTEGDIYDRKISTETKHLFLTHRLHISSKLPANKSSDIDIKKLVGTLFKQCYWR